jgi:nucleoside-diphosphate-sugar epimerase
MARILIVGCGCRGLALGRELGERGHAIRGTSRRADGRAAIEAAGFESAAVDPARLGTLMPQLQGASVLCWLMGDADDPALHTDRFASLLETLVDTHVRGAVYEDPASAEVAARATATYRMPVAAIAAPPADHARWLAAALEAVDSVLLH